MDWLIVAVLTILYASGDACSLPSAAEWQAVMSDESTSAIMVQRLPEYWPWHAVYTSGGEYYAFIGREDSQHGACFWAVPEFRLTLEIQGRVYEMEGP